MEVGTDRIAGVEALFAPTNKNYGGKSTDTAQGPVSPPLAELSLAMDDKTLLKLAKDWEANWLAGKRELTFRQKEMEKYYLGLTNDMGADATLKKPKADNVIFEALETFLPKATQKSPEPVVTADNTPEGQKIAHITQSMLAYLADNKDVNLRMTLRQIARFHQMFFLGAAKIGWSERTKNVTITAVRPQKLILDPDATIENGKYTGKYVGEYLQETASELIRRFPAKKDELIKLCDGKLGTKMQYIEWWSNGEMPAVFWTIKDVVLDKMKNPHFNYAEFTVKTDEFGIETTAEVQGHNHFDEPELPYEFLSVINLGLRPFDSTNGLYQCLAMQDVVSKRWKQIDRNADNTNNGIIASLDYFEEGQAAQAAQALRQGDVMLQPHGQAGEGIKRDSGEPLAPFIYQNLLDARQRVFSVYGVAGSIPSALLKERTVRGKMMTKAADDDRIGGGFTEYLEQFADRIFNQCVQFMYVYYDEPQVGSIVGKERAREFFALRSSDLATVKLSVSVREGSLIPKDSMTKRNEAIELWGANGIDPISFYEALDFPAPRETARMLFLWQSNPAALFPEMQQAQTPLAQVPSSQSPPSQVPAASSNPQSPLPPTNEPSTALPLNNLTT